MRKNRRGTTEVFKMAARNFTARAGILGNQAGAQFKSESSLAADFYLFKIGESRVNGITGHFAPGLK